MLSGYMDTAAALLLDIGEVTINPYFAEHTIRITATTVTG